MNASQRRKRLRDRELRAQLKRMKATSTAVESEAAQQRNRADANERNAHALHVRVEDLLRESAHCDKELDAARAAIKVAQEMIATLQAQRDQAIAERDATIVEYERMRELRAVDATLLEEAAAVRDERDKLRARLDRKARERSVAPLNRKAATLNGGRSREEA